MWFKDEEHTVLHRTDGPAIQSNGGNAWFVEGQLHRLDGPAVIKKQTSIFNDWYLFGIKSNKKEVRKFVATLEQHFGVQGFQNVPHNVLMQIYTTEHNL